MSANRSMPKASATAETSAAADATSRFGRGGRPAVSGPVVGDPSYAEPVRSREKWFGGRPDVGRAVVPEDGEPTSCVIHSSVVGVQRAAVAQLEIGFRNHSPSLRPVPLLFAPELRRMPLSRTRVNRGPSIK